jgi:glycerol dehydrogenase
MPIRIMTAPLRYVQGPDALPRIGEQVQALGIRDPLVLVDKNAREYIEPPLTSAFNAKGVSHAFTEFEGECAWPEIERVKEACIRGGHDAVISCGGGKTLDTGRCAASGRATNVEQSPPEVFEKLGAGVACINVPTVAATDASTSAASLVYAADGTLEATIVFPTNPTMVLVDTSVIAKAPVRLLVSGMGDALATYFEADMCFRTSGPSVQTRAQSTRAAQALARLCLDILMDHGVRAKIEAESRVPGPSLDAVVEANVLLSGLGFESGGLSAAHAVGHAFHHIRHLFERPPFHGELVAFGTLVQLVMEGRKPAFLDTIFAFCRAIGLPTTFSDMSLHGITEEALETVAYVASKDILIQSFVGAKTERDPQGRFFDHREIFLALKATDAYGRATRAHENEGSEH